MNILLLERPYSWYGSGTLGTPFYGNRWIKQFLLRRKETFALPRSYYSKIHQA